VRNWPRSNRLVVVVYGDEVQLREGDKLMVLALE
jgi:hypothetical protein